MGRIRPQNNTIIIGAVIVLALLLIGSGSLKSISGLSSPHRLLSAPINSTGQPLPFINNTAYPVLFYTGGVNGGGTWTQVYSQQWNNFYFYVNGKLAYTISPSTATASATQVEEYVNPANDTNFNNSTYYSWEQYGCGSGGDYCNSFFIAPLISTVNGTAVNITVVGQIYCATTNGETCQQRYGSPTYSNVTVESIMVPVASNGQLGTTSITTVASSTTTTMAGQTYTTTYPATTTIASGYPVQQNSDVIIFGFDFTQWWNNLLNSLGM